MTTTTDLPTTLPAELIADLPHFRQMLTQFADGLAEAIARDGLEPVLTSTYRTMVEDLAEGPEALLAHGLIALLMLAEGRAAPVTWELPPPPDPEVVELWDRDGDKWDRYDVYGGWSQDGGEPGSIWPWQDLLANWGPLSAVPPEPEVPDA
jgi:hypothetical protein